jgi:hypothetical protein
MADTLRERCAKFAYEWTPEEYPDDEPRMRDALVDLVRAERRRFAEKAIDWAAKGLGTSLSDESIRCAIHRAERSETAAAEADE